jgi:integrase/recombinase XerD
LFVSGDESAYTANNLQRRVGRLYERAGFHGCSSHSGRRTAITQAARRMGAHGCSIVDVKEFAGHAFLSSTLPYVDLSDNARSMVVGIEPTPDPVQASRRERARRNAST